MGYTDFTKNMIKALLRVNPEIERVVDLGAQNDHTSTIKPMPYISEWYKQWDIEYECIDINGENGAYQHDLTELKFYHPVNDLVVDAGTLEHLGIDGKFSWLAIWTGWLNKFSLCKPGGIIFSENPLTANWPGHGFNYHTTEFYFQLCESADLELITIGLHPACSNTRNGWNVWCSLRKTGERFPSLEEFKTFDLRTS